MAHDDLNLADLDELVDLIAGTTRDEVGEVVEPGDIEASLDPGDLNLPGVWVALDGWTKSRLRGAELDCRLFLIAPDINPRDAASELAALFNKVKARISPVGRVTTELVAIPGTDGRPLPALAVPVRITTVQES